MIKIKCIYNDPNDLPDGIPNNFDYGLEVDKEYLVMGIAIFKKSDNLYFLVDENSCPNWFPSQIFDITHNSLHYNWFMKVNFDNEHVDYKNLIGFDELCNDENFFNLLLERDENAMRIYFRRKIEMEKEFTEEWCKY